MSLLIKSAHIIDPRSIYHLKKIDILIVDGKIDRINEHISSDDHTLCWEFDNAYISPGWLDVGTQIGEPGYEHREDIESVSRAAAHGGFTGLACYPNTSPPVQTKSQVEYLIKNGKEHIVSLYPLASLSQNLEGENITEMFDLHHSGAVGFTDGEKSIDNNGLMLRALEYVKSFDGLIIHQPTDRNLCSEGIVHEGEYCMQMGIKGIPSVAETIMLQRDLWVNRYAKSRLLVHNISTSQSIQMIRTAKLTDSNIYSSVAYMNLLESDEKILDFNTNFKVWPPLRSDFDSAELIEGVVNGDIDIICSNHTPLEKELKHLEFTYAAFGAVGLQTCFSALWTSLSEHIDLTTLVKCLSINPRKILKLSNPIIEEGAEANLTIFDPDYKWTFDSKTNLSKSMNSPYLGHHFKGKAIALVNGNKHVNLG